MCGDRDESSCAEEKKILDNQRSAHQKELRRLQNEDRSRFMKELGCLNNRCDNNTRVVMTVVWLYCVGYRYQLQCLLGRGGFSEVWKAMDLLELREVAVKVCVCMGVVRRFSMVPIDATMQQSF